MEDYKIDENDQSDTSPDIICIQELDDTKLTKYLTEESIIKYKHFSQKKGSKKLDSVATFWNTDIFDKIDSWTLYFETESKCDIFSKPQVATFVALKILNPENHYYGKDKEHKGNILLVCNTHLLFNNSRGDIKLSQIDLIIKSAAYLKTKLQNDLCKPTFKVNDASDKIGSENHNVNIIF
jgi:mRNA deadenylase 3'-5' endonuclease subunit Ccr4